MFDLGWYKLVCTRMALRAFLGIRFLINSKKIGSLLRFSCSSVLTLVTVTLLVGLCILYAEDSLSYSLFFKSIVIPVSRAVGSDAVFEFISFSIYFYFCASA